MTVKRMWDTDDFNKMGWHDCRLYSVSFPDENLDLKLDIDYVFGVNGEFGVNGFWVSACTLIFYDVLYLKMNLDFSNSINIDISSLEVHNIELSPDGKSHTYSFFISTDKGEIAFKSSGFIQEVRSQPVLSETMDLKRGNFRL